MSGMPLASVVPHERDAFGKCRVSSGGGMKYQPGVAKAMPVERAQEVWSGSSISSSWRRSYESYQKLDCSQFSF